MGLLLIVDKVVDCSLETGNMTGNDEIVTPVLYAGR